MNIFIYTKPKHHLVQYANFESRKLLFATIEFSLCAPLFCSSALDSSAFFLFFILIFVAIYFHLLSSSVYFNFLHFHSSILFSPFGAIIIIVLVAVTPNGVL